jgi:hypothetical protein
MDFNIISDKIFNGDKEITFEINSKSFNIIVFEDEFLLKINDLKYNNLEYKYFDTINGLYNFINTIL